MDEPMGDIVSQSSPSPSVDATIIPIASEPRLDNLPVDSKSIKSSPSRISITWIREINRLILSASLMLFLGGTIAGVGIYIFGDQSNLPKLDRLVEYEISKSKSNNGSEKNDSLENNEVWKLIQEERKEQRTSHRELITLVWTSLVTLSGSALGFYFGEKSAQGRSDD